MFPNAKVNQVNQKCKHLLDFLVDFFAENFIAFMKNIDIKAFRKSNNLTQTQLGDYLECTKAFISAIEKGLRPIPDEMYSKLIDNPNNWDVSMLTQPENPMADEPKADGLVEYLERKVSDQEILIRELYQQIGMLEAKLDLARKGEIARVVAGSSDASAV